MQEIRFSAEFVDAMICPVCKSHVQLLNDEFICQGCGIRYPVVDGIPVIINGQNSIFSVSDYLDHKETTYRRSNGLQEIVARLVPENHASPKTVMNLKKFHDDLHKLSDRPKVLVVGGRILGDGMEWLAGDDSIELVELDVAFGPRCSLISDAHDIPFRDGVFDGVVAQAVLEHVLDPYRVVSEIHRVLKKDGLVFAETPFLVPVHGGAYDFTRFTALGHRRLFRAFEEIESGVGSGPGSMLAWSYEYFLLSFAPSPFWRKVLRVFARFTSFWMPWFDFLLMNARGSLDAASIYYFLGRRSDRILPDRELLALFKGLSTT